MLANPNITNPNSHLDPRHPSLPQIPSKHHEVERNEKATGNCCFLFLHLLISSLNFKSNNIRGQEEIKKHSNQLLPG
jgi:hypothetical protein